MSKECGRKSKALSIGASVAVVTTAAILSAGSYVGLFKRAEDMNTQEREISTELSEIALKSLGEGKDLALDCDISTLEEQFMDEDTYAWVIPNPYPGSGVVHFKSDFCDQFTSNDPYAVARFLFVYAFAVYGYSSDSPCSKMLVAHMYKETYNRRFEDDYEAGRVFTSLVALYIDSTDRCPKSIEEIVGE